MTPSHTRTAAYAGAGHTVSTASPPDGPDQHDGTFRPFLPSRSLFPREEFPLRHPLVMGLLSLLCLLAMPVFAQNNTGIISGRVTDPSGAIIPNAQITTV